jgi:hypothetical protein
VPNPHAAALSRFSNQLGEDELIAWLDPYPGRPSAGSALCGLIELLDGISMEPAVVTALGELRTCRKARAGRSCMGGRQKPK